MKTILPPGALKPNDLYQHEVDTVVTKIHLQRLAVTLSLSHNPPTVHKTLPFSS
jgi:hypothetical protein